MRKGTDDGLSCHIDNWDSYGPPGEAVDGRQYVLKPVRQW